MDFSGEDFLIFWWFGAEEVGVVCECGLFVDGFEECVESSPGVGDGGRDECGEGLEALERGEVVVEADVAVDIFHDEDGAMIGADGKSLVDVRDGLGLLWF